MQHRIGLDMYGTYFIARYTYDGLFLETVYVRLTRLQAEELLPFC